ncbi:Hypothetical predicted protein, partial [Paramuricea clavata]
QSCTRSNPADDASRGIRMQDLLTVLRQLAARERRVVKILQTIQKSRKLRLQYFSNCDVNPNQDSLETRSLELSVGDSSLNAKGQLTTALKTLQRPIHKLVLLVASEDQGNTSDLVAKFQHLFTGTGTELHLDPSIQPVAPKPRRVPFHLRKQVSARIEELEALDIIERVSGPTSWVSPVVAAPKPHNPSEVRVCGDYRQPNRAIIRERHPIPTVE